MTGQNNMNPNGNLYNYTNVIAGRYVGVGIGSHQVRSAFFLAASREKKVKSNTLTQLFFYFFVTKGR